MDGLTWIHFPCLLRKHVLKKIEIEICLDQFLSPSSNSVWTLGCWPWWREMGSIDWTSWGFDLISFSKFQKVRLEIAQERPVKHKPLIKQIWWKKVRERERERRSGFGIFTMRNTGWNPERCGRSLPADRCLESHHFLQIAPHRVIAFGYLSFEQKASFLTCPMLTHAKRPALVHPSHLRAQLQYKLGALKCRIQLCQLPSSTSPQTATTWWIQRWKRLSHLILFLIGAGYRQGPLIRAKEIT